MRLTEAQQNALIDVLRHSAREAILPYFRKLDTGQIAAKTGPDDLVTVADHATEALIAEAARRILPGAPVVGEEAVAADPSLLDHVGDAEQCLIVDPVDGTWNFAHGLTVFGVILAVVERGETVFGLLYDPIVDDWILTRKGGGTWFCRPRRPPVRLEVGHDPGSLSESFGFVEMYLYPQAERPVLAETLTRFRRTGSLRCSCHEYRTLAHGFADFSLNGRLNVWDHAAGVLAVQEAGGVARLLDGREYSPAMREGRLLLAKTERLWSALAETFSGLA